MLRGYDKKSKMKRTDIHSPIELFTIGYNDKYSNDRQPIISKDIDIHNEQTTIRSDDRKTNDQHGVISIGQNEVAGALALVVANVAHIPIDSMSGNCRVVEVFTEEFDSPTTNIMNNITVELGPIVGYAEEPLLPLYKACAPLEDVVHNLYFYVQMALHETPEVPPNGLTIDESAAIRLYTIEWNKPHKSLYAMLNHTLKCKDREHLRPYWKYMKLLLTALAKLPCVPQSTVWRGVTKNVSADFAPATPVTLWSFSSCTTTLPVLENNTYLGKSGSRTLFSVEAVNGRKIRAHSHYTDEDEILLLPGTHMIVQSQFSPAPDLHMIHLKQVIPKEVYLQPPFEGIINITNCLF